MSKKLLFICFVALTVTYLYQMYQGRDKAQQGELFEKNVLEVEVPEIDMEVVDQKTSKNRESKEDNHLVFGLEEQIETFIHLYYDWNYAHLFDKKLDDYVTSRFYDHMKKDSEEDYYEEEEIHLMSEVQVEIENLRIYRPFDNEIKEVLVQFDAFYTVPNNIPFHRNFVVWLEIVSINETWRVNELIEKNN